MFNVNGDVIEYDGKPFAVITARLSGFRMDAVDALNKLDMFSADDVNDILTELECDLKTSNLKTTEQAQKDAWMPDEWAEYIDDKLESGLVENTANIRAKWSIPR